MFRNTVTYFIGQFGDGSGYRWSLSTEIYVTYCDVIRAKIILLADEGLPPPNSIHHARSSASGVSDALSRLLAWKLSFAVGVRPAFPPTSSSRLRRLLELPHRLGLPLGDDFEIGGGSVNDGAGAHNCGNEKYLQMSHLVLRGRSRAQKFQPVRTRNRLVFGFRPWGLLAV
jgi:hypothetical protein